MPNVKVQLQHYFGRTTLSSNDMVPARGDTTCTFSERPAQDCVNAHARALA